MHVNISVACLGGTAKTQEDATRKLYYLVNQHFNLYANLFNRDPSRCGYCNPDRYSDARTIILHNNSSDHHTAFNLGHYDAGRIELRLVGGQSNYACFRNTMETIFHLVSRMKELSWSQLDDVTAVFSGCNQYVLSRIKSHGVARGLVSREDYDIIAATVKREELL